jgi:DNA-binding transcriptional LysR family regulator
MDLDLRRLRSFVAVAKHLNFTRAAEELHLAQPALSRQVRALERELGVVLFERDRRSVALTAAGRQLLEDAVPLLAGADAARRRVQRAARGTRRLVVGFRAGVMVTDAVRAFAEARPDVAVDVLRLEWDEQEEALRDGRVDVAFVRRPIGTDGLRLVPLFAEDRFAVVRADDPLAARDSLVVADLADEVVLRYLATTPSSALGLRTVEEKLEHVASGHGIVLLPRSMVAYYTRSDLVAIPVLDAEPDEVLLACESGRRSRLLADFERAATGVRVST